MLGSPHAGEGSLKPAVVRPRHEGEQSQALGTYLGGSQLMEFRCSPWYFLVRSYILVFVLPWQGGSIRSFLFFALLILFISLLLSSHFVSSVLVACLRCELRPCLVRPLTST